MKLKIGFIGEVLHITSYMLIKSTMIKVGRPTDDTRRAIVNLRNMQNNFIRKLHLNEC